ncbi:MAG TPA: hypothetical protein VHP58_06875 [Alphaproteobacteria bacterium]|nr:hypothetical protein [Alphaproteobacteria bacterium]
METTSLTHLWPWLALAFSFFGALIIGCNQAARLEGNNAVLWRLAGILPLAFASLFFLPWPLEFGVYIGAATLGVVLAFSDVRLYRVSAVFGARLAALYIPLKIALAFLLWSAIAPSSLQIFSSSPGKLLMVIGAFTLGWVAFGNIRKNDLSATAFKALLPVAAGLAAADVLAKLCLPVGNETTLPEIFGRAVAVLTVAALSSAALVVWRQGKVHWPDGRQTLWGIGLGALHLGGLSVLLAALALAPNPGYVGSITILGAVWLAVYAHFFHHEKNNLWAGLVLVFAGGVVAFATGF